MSKSAPHPITPRSQALANLWLCISEGEASAPKAKARASAQGTARNMGMPLDSATAHRLVKRGISSRAIVPLGEFLGLGKGDMAEYLDLDRGTANRRAAKDQPLPTHAAEGVLRMIELDQMAADTFETEAQASQWLRQPHPMLEGESPLAAAKTAFGAQRVKDILLAIKWGGVV